jgi:3-oxoacyl-[acyl-carrier protein] reductase
MSCHELKLAGQVALVTGASRGIGKSIAEKLAQLGASVVINYSSNADAAESAVKAIKDSGGQALAVKCDVSKYPEVEEMIKLTVETFGRLDILVNNAGIAKDALTLRMSAEDWQKTIDINLTGCFNCAKAAIKPMIKAKSGRIINISSVVGQSGNAGQAAYSASKSGLFGLTKSLAKELASRNITVNAVAPGYILTDMTGALSDKVKEEILETIPAKRFAEAEEVADCVAYFCQPTSGYITGQILGINGGMYM